MRKSLLSLLLVVSIGISSYGQQPPKQKSDTVLWVNIRIPLEDYLKSRDSVDRFVIPSQGVRMYTDEQLYYQRITARWRDRLDMNAKLDTVITKSK